MTAQETKPCPHCGQTFTHGERYACCSGCGQAFVGQAAFDAHQRVMDNSLVCLPPEGMTRKDGAPLFEPLQRSGKAGSGTFWRLAPRADAPGNPWRRTDA